MAIGNILAQLVSLLCTLFSLGMLIFAILKLRQETRTSALAPILAMATTLAATVVYLVLVRTPINWLLAVPLLLLGLVVGFGEGQLNKLYYRDDGALMVRRSPGYLIIWGLAYVLMLVMAQAGSAELYGGAMLTLMFGLGVALGSNGGLLVRQGRVKRG